MEKQEESYKKDNFALEEALIDWMNKIHVKNCTILKQNWCKSDKN